MAVQGSLVVVVYTETLSVYSLILKDELLWCRKLSQLKLLAPAGYAGVSFPTTSDGTTGNLGANPTSPRIWVAFGATIFVYDLINVEGNTFVVHEL